MTTADTLEKLLSKVEEGPWILDSCHGNGDYPECWCRRVLQEKYKDDDTKWVFPSGAIDKEMAELLVFIRNHSDEILKKLRE